MYEQYVLEKTPKKGKKTRLCANNMQLFQEHMNSMKKVHKSKSQMCREITYMKCQLCDKHACVKKDNKIATMCCIDFHGDLLHSLGFMDCLELFSVPRNRFKKACQTEIKWNKKHMREHEKI
jgi:hypothetical protein